MAQSALLFQPATLADLEALPPTVKGEIIDGVLHTQPRPRARHQRTIAEIDGRLSDPYDRGRGGPGGWWILPEPGIELPGSPEFSPDVAGWRRARLPELPEESSIQVVPDWICEVLSPSTRSYDQRTKRPFYARIGVHHLWYVDLENKTLTVSRLHEGHWLELGVYGDDETIRAEPFEAVELALTEWWLLGTKATPR